MAMATNWDDYFRFQGLDPNILKDQQNVSLKIGTWCGTRSFSWYNFLINRISSATQRGLSFTIEGFLQHLFSYPKIDSSRGFGFSIVPILPLTFFAPDGNIVLFDDETLTFIGKYDPPFGLISTTSFFTGRRFIQRFDAGHLGGVVLYSQWLNIDLTGATNKLNRPYGFLVHGMYAKQFKTVFTPEKLSSAIFKRDAADLLLSGRLMKAIWQLVNETQTKNVFVEEHSGMPADWEKNIQNLLAQSRQTTLEELLALFEFGIEYRYRATHLNNPADEALYYQYPSFKVF